MNAILGFARLLEEAVTDKEQLEYLHVIIKSGDDLLVILNDILDFSRIEAGKVVFERTTFSVKATVDSIVTMMEPRSVSKNLKFYASVDEHVPKLVIGDPVRLSQILLNLVSNAIKFTDKGEVNISVTGVDENSDNIIIEFAIKDTGIGIPVEKQEKIFESFEQASLGTIRKFGGTGLGLSIVKQLVEMQDGDISVNSSPQNGSEFHFRLPFLKSKNKVYTPIKEKTETPLQKGKGIKVLVVEDNPINQMLVVKVLQKQEFIIDVAENGKVALNKYLNDSYDIILMDLQMPEMDGYEATRNIRNLDSDKKNIPIIAMTAHTIKGEMERCFEIGMNDFISKPFNVNELYEKISDQLHHN